MEEGEHPRNVNPMDAWLPITESRCGNSYYTAFHTLCTGIGFQALMLPVAFSYLGWAWGTINLVLAFSWQLYTLWLLIRLHESAITGTRYSRYLHLCVAAFGEKLAKWLALFPVMYLSAGICTILIVVGGESMKLFFKMECGPTCTSMSLTTVEWYLVFTCIAVVLSQLPNLNSFAGVSLIGAITAICYCTIIWVVSLNKERPVGISYEPMVVRSKINGPLGIINSLGIVAFAFRGHNLTLEIQIVIVSASRWQGTMPSSQKYPSHVPMCKGIIMAYTLIAMCLFAIALAGYWAYGNLMPESGILTAMYMFHGHDTSIVLLGTTSFLVLIHCMSSYQIYAMPIFDNMEFGYTNKHNKPCPQWLRSGFRTCFGFLNFFIAIAFPFLSRLVGLFGAVSLPMTLAYPCFMWILIKKPKRNSIMWYANWSLGCLGMALNAILVVGAVWTLGNTGLKLQFFKT